MKNLFGVLPGLSKVGYHATHPSQEQFADVLLDLAEYVRPRLSIMDGVLGPNIPILTPWMAASSIAAPFALSSSRASITPMIGAATYG